MPVAFSPANGRTSTIQNMFTQLHATLLAAGWTLVFADADAIGAGTAENPAWNKAPAVNTNAGRVIYQMPAVAGFPTRWCVELAVSWGSSNTTMQNVAMRLGTEAGGDGTLTGAGTTHRANVNNAAGNATSTEWYVNAYEHGLLLALHIINGGFLLALERRRRLDGTVIDDATAYGCVVGGGNIGAVGTQSAVQQGVAQTRSVSAGEYNAQSWAVFATGGGSAVFTLNRMDGATGIPQGPFNVSGGTAGLPRLFVFLPPNDCTAGVDSTLYADGANRAYHVAVSTSVLHASSSAMGRVAYAKE
ncbi:hypothetical protein [Deinococcus sp. NW-56]|uniref:hypothetical protein n=1 Tax=Deinococcus sp. NW-56 TaxID=2080419 RepID=UPI000CF37047|nr:hypothetical protein [Deinococcus sp. NW-56]